MLQRIKLQTLDGIREYKFVPSAAALTAAAGAGEISVGEDIVYREYIVMVLEDYELLVIDRIPAPSMNPGFEFVPPPNGWNGGQWSFTVNGQPMTPEQMAQFMNGGSAT